MEEVFLALVCIPENNPRSVFLRWGAFLMSLCMNGFYCYKRIRSNTPIDMTKRDDLNYLAAETKMNIQFEIIREEIVAALPG